MQQEIELFLQGFETEAVAALAGNRCHLTGKLPARFASRLLSMPISASDPLAHGAIHIFISIARTKAQSSCRQVCPLAGRKAQSRACHKTK